MNPQQVAQSRSSANGFNRRRSEKEIGNKMENKSQPGKSNFNSMITGNKGGIESPSRDRLVYLTTCLIGHQVEVQVIDGSVISGIFHATNAEKDFGIILKMARVTKTRGQKSFLDSVQKPPSRTLIIPSKDLVQIVAKSVSVTRDGLTNELQHDQLHDILIDSSISQSKHVDLGRELEPWVPDDDNLDCPELDNTFDRHWNRGWDQFEANATLFGVKSTFNEELYTTKLDRGPQMLEREREALRIAREIECEDTQDLHLAEERGIHFHDKFDLDEETKYSSVFRVVDDSGYDENEDILDSQNDETFGDVSDSIINKSFSDFKSGKSNNVSKLPSNFPNLIEVSDLLPSGLLDGQSSNQEPNYIQEDTSKESGSDKLLSATATAYSPTNVPSTTATSASSTSESANVAPTAAASAPGLSPSSSMASLTSEKSTLNPHAKEFRLNPNAKSFVPSPPAPLRASSPVPETSFYYPAPVPHMHGMPPGVGMGPSFPPHQPVLYGPQGTPLQSPQPYFHPNGPQYGGQQMLYGQQRPVVYMPTYPPETPYKGRDF